MATPGKKRYLTKTRFKVGYDCPSKLNYLDDATFGNNNKENYFLEALAEGGFQVGELAKLYHPGGIEITETDKQKAVLETNQLLAKNNAIVYEAAVMFDNLFVKADILIKSGNALEVIEVKAKSFDSNEEDPFYTKGSVKQGTLKLNSEWEPYIIDIAFQSFVLRKAYPSLRIKSFLMLADKNTAATVDGLNQKFLLIKSESGRTSVRVSKGTSEKTIGTPILTKISVDEAVQLVWDSHFDGKSFEELVAYLSQGCENGIREMPSLGTKCKNCEFRINKKKTQSGLKSGFEKCWTDSAKLVPKDFEKPFVFDIWNFRKSAKLLQEGVLFAEQLEEEDVNPTAKNEDAGLSSSERQWLQVEKIKSKDMKPYLDHQALKSQMKSWQFPLHFIDFETTMAAELSDHQRNEMR